MATICNCNTGLGNTGEGSCDPVGKVAKKLILTEYLDASGAVKSIDPTTTLDAAFFSALVNHADTSERWYPLPLMENVENVRADSVTQTFNSGKSIAVQQGIRSFTALLPNKSNAYAKKLQQAACKPLGFYIVDKDGNLMGDGSDVTELKPIKIDQDTWEVNYSFATDTEVSAAVLSFEWDQSVDDGDVRIIKKTEIDYNLFLLRGLLDVFGVNLTAISTTGFTIDLQACYGSLSDLEKITGLLAGDFTLYNVTDSASVTILTATEAPAGTYAFTYAAQDSSDVLRLSVSKDGLDSAELETVVITTP